jgi:hypothetical protein
MNKIGIIGHGRAREFLEMFRAISSAPPKCSECVAYHAEGNMSVPCNGDFLEHCEYNGTDDDEDGDGEQE